MRIDLSEPIIYEKLQKSYVLSLYAQLKICLSWQFSVRKSHKNRNSLTKIYHTVTSNKRAWVGAWVKEMKFKKENGRIRVLAF